MNIVPLRLKNGQDLLEEIEKIASQKNIKAGVILSGVGSLESSNIRLPVSKKGSVNYINPKITEIVSLHGTVSKNGCHIHIVISDEQGKVYGGHLKSGNIVRTTCELVIGTLEGITFRREPDSQSGYDELEVASD